MARVRCQNNHEPSCKPIQYTFLPPITLSTSKHDSNIKTIERRVRDTRRSDYDQQARSQRFYTLYKKLLFTVSSSLTSTDITDLKYLCRDYIQPRHHIDEVRNSWSFIVLLENKKLLAANSLVFLQTLLYHVGRTDLYGLVLKFRADRQKEYKVDGVDIRHMLEDKNHDPKRMELTQDMLEFRRKLKKSRRNNKPNNIAILQQRLSELNTRVQHNIDEMASYRRKLKGDQGPTVQAIRPVHEEDGSPKNDIQEIPCKQDESTINPRSDPVRKIPNETLENVLNINTKNINTNEKQNKPMQIIKKTKHSKIVKKMESSTQLDAAQKKQPHREKYTLSEEVVLAETSMLPPNKEFTVKSQEIHGKYEGLTTYNVPSNTKQDTHVAVIVPMKIKQIRNRFRKGDLHKMMRFQITKRTKHKKPTKTPHLNSEDCLMSESVPVIFPDIYDKYARTSRLPVNATNP